MKTIINQSRFTKAVEHASANYFATPYSITSVVDRWFNQLSMIEMNNDKFIHLSGDVARALVDIKVDGVVVPKEEIDLVMKFYSKSSNYELEREALVRRIDALKAIPLVDDESEATLAAKKELAGKEAELVGFDASKVKAEALYKKIVERGASSLNVERIEQKYGSTLKNIVHRPNHGLTHSVRAAYSVTALQTYREKHGIAAKCLNESEIEKTQMMMLFSVVGRKDETGFSDTGPKAGETGNLTYQSFRTSSGRAYLKYFRDNTEPLYGDALDNIYRDAIVVELMGYSGIQNTIDRKKTPEVFIDYVIEKEAKAGRIIAREAALRLIMLPKGEYSLDKLFPAGPIRTLADDKLAMMNDAHGLDLTRCYSLYPTSQGGAKSIGVLSYHLYQAKFSSFVDAPDPAKLTSFFELMRCSFDALEATGQNSMFGMLSKEEFAAKKDDILGRVKAISDDCKNPARRADLLLEAAAASAADDKDNYFSSKRAGNDLLADYRDYLITRCIAEALKVGKKLSPDKRMFNFNHVIDRDVSRIDHRRNAVSLVQSMQTITPVPGVTQLPLISAVKHHRARGVVETMFDERLQAEHFQDTYAALTGKVPAITQNEKGQFIVEVDRGQYKQLVTARLVEFKPVKIPDAVEREAFLVDKEGGIDVLNLIKHSRALGRLVSTTPSKIGDPIEYDYFFNALDDPLHQRYSPVAIDIAAWPADRARYHDPRGGVAIARKIDASPPPELRFQEPVTEPASLEDRQADGLVVGAQKKTAKNTIFTKKMSHSMIPHHGKMIPFEGVREKAINYFPIGVLSDVEQVDLKGGRYIWSENMSTFTKFWLRDNGRSDKNII